EDAAPVTSAAIIPTFIPAPADEWLHHSIDRISLADFVDSQRPPRAHLLRKYSPRYLRWSLNTNHLPNAVRVEIALTGHRIFLSLAASRSASRLNAKSVSSQNPSSQSIWRTVALVWATWPATQSIGLLCSVGERHNSSCVRPSSAWSTK